jgi:O-antigen/teichoic acid export membrane protein
MSRIRLDFFRQSAWMVMSTTLGGVFFTAVHKLAKNMPKDEYGVFCALLQVLTLMTIPATALQMTMVRKSVAAMEGRREELTGALRALGVGAVVLWSVVALLVLSFQQRLMANYAITNAAALWITLGVGLASLISPLLLGTLQGQQNFLWLGGASMSNAIGRFIAVAVIVGKFGGQAAGAMLGALVGMLVAIGLAGWHVREWWRGPGTPFAWWAWVKQVAPLTIGLGSVIVMVAADMLAVQQFFPESETGYYGAVGTIGRALYFFTAPMALVLFPKIVRSSMRSEKSTVLAQAVGATACLGMLAALACTLLPELPLRILYDPSYLKLAPLVPQFAWCMLPVTVSAVLINDLLARERFGVVYWLAAIAVGYWVTLQRRHESFEQVIHTLGLFGSLMLVGSLAFAWWNRKKRTTNPTSNPPLSPPRQ